MALFGRANKAEKTENEIDNVLRLPAAACLLLLLLLLHRAGVYSKEGTLRFVATAVDIQVSFSQYTTAVLRGTTVNRTKYCS